MRRCFLILLAGMLLCTVGLAGAENGLISDEPTRLTALYAIFPGMKVFGGRPRQADYSSMQKESDALISFPDALAREKVYLVVGKRMNEAEREASQDVASMKSSNKRQLRFRLYAWPNEGDAGELAVLQYDFLGVAPALSTPSIGLLVHLVKKQANWTVEGEYLLETMHHASLQSIELRDLTGDGVKELVVESDFGGAGTVASSL